MVADFDPVHKGLECFASEDRKGGSTDKYLLSADGKPLGKNEEVPSCRNWAWWDGDLLRETFKGDDELHNFYIFRLASMWCDGLLPEDWLCRYVFHRAMR